MMGIFHSVSVTASIDQKTQAVLIPEDDLKFLEQCERGRRAGRRTKGT